MTRECKLCRSAPVAVEGLCIVCMNERLRVAYPVDPKEEQRLPEKLLRPPGMLTTEEFAALIERKPRAARNRCAQLIELGIAAKMPRPMGGLEVWVHERGFAASEAGDTGVVADARRDVASCRSLRS